MHDMSTVSMVSPEDQGATFVELFFDLVFVFAITQVTHYAAHHLDVHGLFRAVLVFWLIWWGWTQFTWALNAADTTHQHVQLGTLVATGIAFVMAVSVDRAFAADPRDAIWFAGAYVAVRTLGLGLYYQVLKGEDEHRSAVATFAVLSAGGLVAVLVGAFVAPALRTWFWLGTAALDFLAAWIAGRRRMFRIHPGHFAERHGLIVIIALGESLIIAASALTAEVTPTLMLTGAVTVLVTCLLWWTYFGWVMGVLEERLIEAQGTERTLLARDAYSFWHFPLVSGIIALAVAFEASLHPGDYAASQAAVALAVGLGLFLLSTAGALWRGCGCVLWNRILVFCVTAAAIVARASSSPLELLGIAALGLIVIVAIEQVTIRRKLQQAEAS